MSHASGYIREYWSGFFRIGSFQSVENSTPKNQMQFSA